MKLILSVILLFVINLNTLSGEYTSPYKSQVRNQIKALTPSELDGLKKGFGTPFGGMAKAAELNGLPGPRHVLDMKKKISLSSKQLKDITGIFKKMQKRAQVLGAQLIQIETEMDKKLKSGVMTPNLLDNLVKKSANRYGELRFAHLVAHLETRAILSKDQVDLYNKLRGYFTSDPCKNTPKGHPVEMWKKHHGCD